MALTRPREYQINTSKVELEDPIITLNEYQTGVNNTDIGFVMNRGTSGNVGFIWEEATKQFRFVQTPETGAEQVGDINVMGNAPSCLVSSSFLQATSL